MRENYLEDLKEIREIMNRSSRFASLSGLSGISAGITALIGAYLAYRFVFAGTGYLSFERAFMTPQALSNLLWIAGGTLVVSIFLVISLTIRETSKRNLNIWDGHARRILINLSIPLLSGGIVCLVLLFQGYTGVILPMTLIFYGLALVHASTFTVGEIRSLGILEIILGLTALFAVEHGLMLWSAGFGVLHIVYGILVKSKYAS